MSRRNKILCAGISIVTFILFLMSFFELISWGVSSSAAEAQEQRYISEDTYNSRLTLVEMDRQVLYKPSLNSFGPSGILSSGLKKSGFFNGIWRAIGFLFAFFAIKNIVLIQGDGRLLAQFFRCDFWLAFYLFRLNVLQEEDGKKRIDQETYSLLKSDYVS